MGDLRTLTRHPRRGERSAVRSALIGAGLLWYTFAMLRGPDHPRLGLATGDLLFTAGVLVSVGCLAASLFVHACRTPYEEVFYAVAAVVGVPVYAFAADRPGSALLFAACGFCAVTTPLRRSVPVLAFTAAGMFVTILLQHRQPGELWTIVGLIGMFAAVRAGAVRESARLTEQENLILAERSHIAREIHDVLAHSLSAQLVHLEGARLLIVGGRTDEALERVERARGLARSGLEETRRALATLRGDIPPIDEVLQELAGEHRTLADARCEVGIDGHPGELPPKAGLAVIRTAQEALTNVRKHAPGADVAITLRRDGGWCELDVTDTGGTERPGPLAESGGGYGLVGMRERAELIGGTLEAGPAGDGFRVLLRVRL